MFKSDIRFMVTFCVTWFIQRVTRQSISPYHFKISIDWVIEQNHSTTTYKDDSELQVEWGNFHVKLNSYLYSIQMITKEYDVSKDLNNHPDNAMTKWKITFKIKVKYINKEQTYPNITYSS